jgi:O-antigen ligase
MRSFPLVATVHALGTFALGLIWLARDSVPYRLIYLAAYITGAEMLWRMTNAAVFWEFGKYSISLLLILAMLKHQRLSRADKRPFLYFILLLPSAILALDRDKLSFNLSGPFSLAVAAMFFSTVRLARDQMERIFIAIVLPIVGVSFLALSSTLSATDLVFSGGANTITSGNIGPNQVSASLGLGLLAAVLFVVCRREKSLLSLVMLGCAVWLGAQCALTFSRGGLLTAFGAIAVALVYLLRDRRSRGVALAAVVTTLLITVSLVIPFLADFTEGQIGSRFSDLNLTGRDIIMESDWLAFQENPLFGVGPGNSPEYHARTFRAALAHTEYTRMLSEHGLFGLLSLLMLLLMALQRFGAKLPPLEKAYVVSFTVWGLLYMFHSAMRLVMPGFMFGLAGAILVAETEEPARVEAVPWNGHAVDAANGALWRHGKSE